MNLEGVISLQEQQNLSSYISDLVARHNTLCRIEEAFRRNGTAKEYLDNAAEEILESGNQSISLKYVVAIENMTSDIDDYECDQNVDELLYQVFNLKAENKLLKTRLNRILEAVKNATE